jgi:predicted GNAT family acetyltransferase
MQALPLTPDLHDQAMALLRARRETSLFLLGNLDQHGPGPTANLNSGLFQCLVDDGQVRAVFQLTRRGNLLVQTDRQADYGREILQAVAEVPTPVNGLVGDWALMEPLSRQLEGFKPGFVSKEVLYSRPNAQDGPATPPEGSVVRKLNALDFSAWDALMLAMREEAGLPMAGYGSIDEREANFKAGIPLERYWGAFVNGRMLATASLNAVADGLGQVGGVYTVPTVRRMGLSRAVMQQLIHDRQDLAGLVLFTGEENHNARAMYRGLGFEEVGDFGLIFRE